MVLETKSLSNTHSRMYPRQLHPHDLRPWRESLGPGRGTQRFTENKGREALRKALREEAPAIERPQVSKWSHQFNLPPPPQPLTAALGKQSLAEGRFIGNPETSPFPAEGPPAVLHEGLWESLRQHRSHYLIDYVCS